MGYLIILWSYVHLLLRLLLKIITPGVSGECLKKFYSNLKYFTNRYKIDKSKNYQGKNFIL